MSFLDDYVYSPEKKGELLEYLRSKCRTSTDNMFLGPEHFYAIKNLGIIIPDQTHLRVNRSPLPDFGYFVNSEFMLESPGPEEHNMSLIWAPKGSYDPRKALRGMVWSISGLKLWTK